MIVVAASENIPDPRIAIGMTPHPHLHPAWRMRTQVQEATSPEAAHRGRYPLAISKGVLLGED